MAGTKKSPLKTFQCNRHNDICVIKTFDVILSKHQCQRFHLYVHPIQIFYVLWNFHISNWANRRKLSHQFSSYWMMNDRILSVCIWSMFSLRCLFSWIHIMMVIITTSVEALSLMVSTSWPQLTVSSGWVSHSSLLPSTYTYFLYLWTCNIDNFI